jgi:hypothetical protein
MEAEKVPFPPTFRAEKPTFRAENRLFSGKDTLLSISRAQGSELALAVRAATV